uniref:Large ribosomal subunit protein bL17m n=1 Tax=Panagrellus redivivus TaxID=6233 RepID=A0A7E4ZQL1_PANRE
MAHRIVPSLPRIKVPIGHIPQRLKARPFEAPQGRLEVLRQFVTRLVREERIEMKANRAEETRPYIERLIQLGVFRGMNDDYTQEMMQWWLLEKDLVDKMEHVIVPRFQEAPINEPYTNLFNLPFTRYENRVRGKRIHYNARPLAVIEIKGNPYPEIGA